MGLVRYTDLTHGGWGGVGEVHRSYTWRVGWGGVGEVQKSLHLGSGVGLVRLKNPYTRGVGWGW